MQLEIFFFHKVDTYLKLPTQKMLLEMFYSDAVTAPLSNQFKQKQKNPSILRPKEKIFIDADEKTFLRKLDAYLKLPVQKIYLKTCRCNI